MKSKFLSRGIPYLGGFFLQRLTSFALLPLFVVTMSPEDFSRFGLLVSAITLLSAVMTFRVHVAPSRLIFDGSNKNIASSVIVSSLILSGLIFFVSTVALIAITNFFKIDDVLTRDSVFELGLIISIVFFRMVSELFSLMMRAKGYANKFFLMAFSEGIVVLVFLGSYYFDSTDKYFTVLLSLAVSSMVSSVLGVYFMLGELKGGKNQTSLYPSILNYTVPLGAYLVVNWMTVSSARWFGAKYVGMLELASYTVIAMVFVVVSMVIRVVFEVLRPELSRAFASGDIVEGDCLLSKSMGIATVLVVVIYLMIFTLFSIVSVLYANKFNINNMPPLIYIVFAFIANLIDVLYAKEMSRMVMLKKSYVLLKSGLVCAIIVLFLNYYFVIENRGYGLAMVLPITVFIQVVVLKVMSSYFYNKTLQDN